jgi:thioredoxin 1
MKNSFNSILNSEIPVLIDFYATWCGPCKSLSPILDKLKKELGDSIKIIKIDVDKNQPLAQKNNVKGVPTLLLFKKGKQVWRQSGVVSKNDLIQVINSNK